MISLIVSAIEFSAHLIVQINNYLYQDIRDTLTEPTSHDQLFTNQSDTFDGIIEKTHFQHDSLAIHYQSNQYPMYQNEIYNTTNEFSPNPSSKDGTLILSVCYLTVTIALIGYLSCFYFKCKEETNTADDLMTKDKPITTEFTPISAPDKICNSATEQNKSDEIIDDEKNKYYIQLYKHLLNMDNKILVSKIKNYISNHKSSDLLATLYALKTIISSSQPTQTSNLELTKIIDKNILEITASHLPPFKKASEMMNELFTPFIQK